MRKEINKIMHDERMNLTPLEFSQFGFTKDEKVTIDTIEELREATPTIVLAECIKDVTFFIDRMNRQMLKKKNKYLMPLAMYSQLKQDREGNRYLKPATSKFKNLFKPYRGEDLNGKNVLVNRTGGFGDLLFIQVFLIHLKEKYPDVKFTFSCSPRFQPITNSWDCIDGYVDMPISMQKLISFDYHIIFSGLIERCKEAERTNVYHLINKWLELDVPEEKMIPKLKPNKEYDQDIELFMKHNNLQEDDFIAIQLFASSEIRTPFRNTVWKNIIKELLKRNHKIVIVDAPNKQEIIQTYLNQYFKDNPNIVSFAQFSKTIEHTINLVNRSKLIIGCDSSLMHVGAALNRRIFGIFGPFTGEVRLTTYKNCDWVNAPSGELTCCPCFSHGSRCEHGSACFENIDILDTIEKIENLINKPIEERE